MFRFLAFLFVFFAPAAFAFNALPISASNPFDASGCPAGTINTPAVCPAGSGYVLYGNNNCYRPGYVVPAPYNTLQFLNCKPAYKGSGGLTICDSAGVCTGNVFSDANAACQSYGTGPIGNAPGAHSDKLSGNSCAATQCFSNGACTTTTYDLTSGLPVGSPTTTPPPTPASGVPSTTPTTTPASGVPSTTPTTTPSSGVPSTTPTTTPSSGVPGTGSGGGTSSGSGGSGVGTSSGSGTGSGTSPTSSPASGTPATDICVTDPTSNPQLCFGAAPASDVIPVSAPVFDNSPVPFLSATGCPADITFTVDLPYIGFNQTYSISYAPFCNFASTVRPLFLALGAISAAIIFVAGLTL